MVIFTDIVVQSGNIVIIEFKITPITDPNLHLFSFLIYSSHMINYQRKGKSQSIMMRYALQCTAFYILARDLEIVGTYCKTLLNQVLNGRSSAVSQLG